MNIKKFAPTFTMLIFTVMAGSAQAVVSSIATDTSTVTQLTNSPDFFYYSRDPDISKDGSRIVFSSEADLIPGGNPDNMENIFIINSDGTGLKQLTFAKIDPTYPDKYYTARMPRLSADGSVVVFASNYNPTGENPHEYVVEGDYYMSSKYQIFIINNDGSGIKQLTYGTDGHSKYPRISDDGNIIAFESTQDLVGENDDSVFFTEDPEDYDGNTREIYVVNADGTNLSQITRGAPKTDNVRDDASRNVSISGDGTTIAFDSFVDLIPPKNDDHSNEIFVFDLAGYRENGATIDDLPTYTVQITDTDIDADFHIREEDAFEPSLSYDGTWVAFSACINPNGEGIKNTERTILGDNPFLPDVIFMAKRDGTELRQLTFSDDPDAYIDDSGWRNIDDDAHWPEISDDGKKIIFSSRSRVDIDNVDSESEIAMIDLAAPLGDDGRPVVKQLSNGERPDVIQLTVGNTDIARLRPSISSNGTDIVFRATSDFTGGNPDFSDEIFKVQPLVISPPTTDDDMDNSNTDDTAGTAGDTATVDNSVADDSAAVDDKENKDSSTTTEVGTADAGGVAAFGISELLLIILAFAVLPLRFRRLPKRVRLY